MPRKYSMAAGLFFILVVSAFISGCAPLLVGAGAVGGYEMATHNK
jgi:hypothetical protein